jgi:hypothetical protein
MPLTREEARKIYQRGEEAVVDLLVRLTEETVFLHSRIEQLENQLAKDSHTIKKFPNGFPSYQLNRK